MYAHSRLFMRKTIFLVFAFVGICSAANADSLTNRLEQMRPELIKQFSVPLEQWRFQQADITNAERPDFDDGSWQVISPRFSWSDPSNTIWFRAKVTVPATVAGLSVANVPVRLELGLSNRCVLYIDGQQRDDFRRNSEY